jgi:hypothetical protein
LKNLHLIISVIVVIPAAFIYGIFPSGILPYLFDFRVETVDLNNVFRAIMCLYLATAVLWVLGIFKPRYWETATLVNIVFMIGLAAGRILSLLIDGFPSIAFAIGLVGELTLGLFSWYQLKKYA